MFVYRQLLPFISKLCIWKRRKDLMPLFAAESKCSRILQKAVYPSIILDAETGRRSKPLGCHPLGILGSLWHPLPLPTHCNSSVWGQRGITSTFCISSDHSSLCQQPWRHFKSQASPVAVADKPPCYPFMPRKTPATLSLGAPCNQTRQSR